MAELTVPSSEQSIEQLPPTLKNIIEGRAKITHLGEGRVLMDRTITGREYKGSAHIYSVTLPDPLKPGEMWTTHLTRWDPLPTPPKPFERNPDPQLLINSGEGLIPFSTNPEIVNKVSVEINRQMEEQRKATEQKASPSNF